MNDSETIKVKKYRSCIIVPFSYDNNFFECMLKEKKGIDGLFSGYLDKVLIKSSTPFNAKETFTEKCKESNRTLQCYEPSNKGREKLKLSQKKEQLYVLNKKKIEFKIGKIKAWFFKNGRGYLTLEILLSDTLPVDLEKALEFNRVHWMYDEEFSQKGNEQKPGEVESVRMKTVVEECLAMLENIGVKERVAEDKNYYLTLAMTDAEGVQEDILHRIILKFPLGKTINEEQKKKMQSYDPYSYIHWKVTGNAVAVMTDNNVTQEKDKNVLNDFDNRVFNHYLIAYLYCLSNYNRYEQLKDGWDSKSDNSTVNQMRDKIQAETTISEIAASGYEHMDKLFCDILRDRVWKYSKKIERFKEEVKYDVFISYRHDGGQYLALLLYKHLKKKNIKVFWDKYCLRAGHFDEQLYKQIEQSRNLIVILSPHCIERLMEEDDWICKELYRALRNSVPVLMITMENVRFPDKEMVEQLMQSENMKELSEESKKRVEFVLKELIKCQGISADVAFFDGVVDRIEAALHLKNLSKRHSGKN